VRRKTSSRGDLWTRRHGGDSFSCPLLGASALRCKGFRSCVDPLTVGRWPATTGPYGQSLRPKPPNSASDKRAERECDELRRELEEVRPRGRPWWVLGLLVIVVLTTLVVLSLGLSSQPRRRNLPRARIDHPYGGCIAPRDVVALGATAPHRSRGKGVQEMHLLQIEHLISVEQVAQTVMEEFIEDIEEL